MRSFFLLALALARSVAGQNADDSAQEDDFSAASLPRPSPPRPPTSGPVKAIDTHAHFVVRRRGEDLR